MEVKKIYCFGTSFSAGGGFHFDIEKIYLPKAYGNLDEEMTQSNFSWPGQLQKLLPNVEVVNLAKCGYGNERIYRLAYDLSISPDFNKDETLFLIESSWTGRKEYFSHKLNDFMILNYQTNDEIHGYARAYHQTEEKSNEDIKQLPDWNFFKDLFETTFNEKVTEDLLRNNMTTFLSSLKNRGISYLFLEPPYFVYPQYQDELVKPYVIDRFPDTHVYNHWEEKNGTIRKETNNYIPDGHFGLVTNKLIASLIHDECIDRGFIKGDMLNRTRDDFNDIQTKIKQNVNRYLPKTI